MKLLEIPEQVPSDEVDEEILEIFVEEVEEVMGEIVSSFAAWRDNPADSEALQTLRRNFHTLKGSGRLVGATAIGELGWRFENLLNRVLDGAIPQNSLILGLIGRVEDVIPDMIERFKTHQAPNYDQVLLISQADHLSNTKGASIGEFDAPTAEDAVAETVASDAAPVDMSSEVSNDVVEPESEQPVEAETVELAELPSLEDDLPELPDLEEELDSGLPDLPDLDAEDLGETDSFGDLLADDGDLSLDDLSTDALGDFADELGEGDLPALPDDDALADLPSLDDLEDSDALTEDTDLADLPELASDDDDDDAALLAELSDFSLDDLASADIESLETSEEEALDPVLLEIFRKEATAHLAVLNAFLTECEHAPNSIKVGQDVVRACHTLNGSSRSVNLNTISNIAAPLESLSRQLESRDMVLTENGHAIFREAVTQIEAILAGELPAETVQSELLSRIQAEQQTLPATKTPIESSAAKPAPAASASSSSAAAELPDASDEFMSIFLDEAEEILENTQSLLERWQASPQNMQLMKELQRELHTLKGGARMVGIVSMGDLSHHLESVLTKIVEGNAQSNSRLQEIVQTSVDELAAMLEAVRSGVPLEMPNDLIAQINTSLSGGGGEEEASAPAPATPSPSSSATPPAGMTRAAPVKSATKAAAETAAAESARPERSEERELDSEGAEDRIRVRVSLIDKLTNLAGELSISRAHMEQQQGAVKNNLVEMDQTVTRLRDQLRRLEIETEAQIMSHFSDAMDPGDDEFDPLELDRFSVMQQLSRSLLETISDLLSIQDIMKTLTRQSDALLIQQSRVGAELQEGIMRTRMIPFSRISPRLQRIARLTARELRKQVEFMIEGEGIEFERTVLNRIVAPLEHLLRNAIGHGIEDAETRQQAGKPTIAHVKIQLAKEGSDLIIKLSDDGAGLNLSAIRRKAEERNMIKPDTVISDQDLMQFILEPSFSTAQKITQVSGRGVGMDVVNSEIKQLGGTLQIHSKTGEGAMFEIRLPLSLTINQALLVHIGEETLAIPLNNVDAVMRLPRQDVFGNSPEDVRHYRYMDHDYRVFHLGELLGLGKGSLDSALIPTLLVRAGDRRVAFLVDGIEGSKEVVVKAVGPQIGAIRWIAGATILGDGRVVLILDVPTLTRIESTPQYEAMQAVEEVVEEKIPSKTIMVVDDSITVRKVTARLLKRQGMEVLTAKDGVDAVAQLQEHIPDLMLLDVEMPRMDGYELATQVRNTPELKHIPIIMITSRTGAKHRDKAEKIGINRYLGKPFNETELLENINALLAESLEKRGQNGDQGQADTWSM